MAMKPKKAKAGKKGIVKMSGTGSKGRGMPKLMMGAKSVNAKVTKKSSV